MSILIAFTRAVSPGMAACELTYLPRVEIDLALAGAQHRAYQEALAESGCEVVSLPAAPELPDSVFVEDTAIILDEIAILTRPGAPSRRPEIDLIAPHLAAYRPLRFLQPPATLDGGDVLRVGKTLYVGLSGRSNAAGIGQLRSLAGPYGYSVEPVPVTGCLHLKSAVTQVAPETLLYNPSWVKDDCFKGYSLIEVDPREPQAANVLLAGDAAIYPASFPHTLERLEERGIYIRTVDVSELQKAEGAVTCCSLVFSILPAAA